MFGKRHPFSTQDESDYEFIAVHILFQATPKVNPLTAWIGIPPPNVAKFPEQYHQPLIMCRKISLNKQAPKRSPYPFVDQYERRNRKASS